MYKKKFEEKLEKSTITKENFYYYFFQITNFYKHLWFITICDENFRKFTIEKGRSIVSYFFIENYEFLQTYIAIVAIFYEN